MQYKDYYKVLGVERKADEKAIKSAYRKLARQYHPDVNPGDKEAEKRFQEINEAYEVLSDSENRQKYDTLGQYWKQGSAPGAGRAGGRPPGGTGNFDFSYENLGDLFAGATAGGGAGSGFSSFFDRFFTSSRQRPPESRPATATAEVEISLEDAFQGTTVMLEMNESRQCSACGGVGVTTAGVCTRCRGSGQEGSPRRVEVKIPPGAARVKAGEVVVNVRLKAPPDYEIKGRDLIKRQTISLTRAMLGGELEVRTPKGQTLSVKVAPETQNGKNIRFKGLGLPGSGGKPAGDLYVRLEVELPANLTEEERELFRQLARLRP